MATRRAVKSDIALLVDNQNESRCRSFFAKVVQVARQNASTCTCNTCATVCNTRFIVPASFSVGFDVNILLLSGAVELWYRHG
jgi:hypothetical protein